jgi:hypothetical protein
VLAVGLFIGSWLAQLDCLPLGESAPLSHPIDETKVF